MDRDRCIGLLYEGLAFVSRQSRELGTYLHPELPLVAHSLLMYIDAEPGSRAVDVAAAYGLDKSTVSRQLAGLEADGLVRRAGERPGRRGQVLELTGEGVAVLSRAVSSSRTTLAAHLSDWDDGDLESLATLLSRFIDTSRRARHAGSPHGRLVGVGYQGLDIEAFVRGLVRQGVDVVVDVRLNAVSRTPGFSRTALTRALVAAGIGYRHEAALGNPKDNRAGFRSTDPGTASAARSRYADLLGEPAAVAALERLRRDAEDHVVGVLCFEVDEEHCHRHQVLAAARLSHRRTAVRGADRRGPCR